MKPRRLVDEAEIEKMTMEELLAEATVFNVSDFYRERDRLLAHFTAVYGLKTSAAVDEAIRTYAITETWQVEEWLGLVAFRQYMDPDGRLGL